MKPRAHADLIKQWADDDTAVVMQRSEGYYGHYEWHEDSLPIWHLKMEYMIVDKYADLRVAAKDPNKEIRVHGSDGYVSDWLSGVDWKFDSPPENYEVRDKPDPYAELKAAAQDPMKQIRVKSSVTWVDGGNPDDWIWQLPPEDYEIRDKPTKVKMWQWIFKDADDDNEVRITQRFFKEQPEWTGTEFIGPAPWTEIEVEE
jgi:hypothetical protein